MLPPDSEVLVLTPRGGMDNHRFITWSKSALDSASCGRIYREVKSILGEQGRGVGSLSDGNWCAAASHVVAQEEAAGRRGSEWLIFTDPRIGSLSEVERDRLLTDVEQHLALIRDEVLGRIAWEKFAGSDTIKDAALDSWANRFAKHLDGVLAEAPVGAGPRGDERARSGWRSSPTILGLTMIAGVVALLFVMQIVVGPFKQPFGGGQNAVQRTGQELLVKASAALGSEATESRVKERLTQFFAVPVKSEERNVEEILEELRGVAMGRDRGAMPLVEDETFWKALEDAVKRRDRGAFLSGSDRDVLKGLNDPGGVRKLAGIARQFREMDKDAARPDDQLLRPLFNGLCKCSEEISRIGEEPAVVVFTSSDARLARALLAAFKEAAAEVERNTKAVSDKEQLAAWVNALGSAQGNDLFSNNYFSGALAVADKNATQPKRECLQRLKAFCEACQEMSKSASMR
jgi:hypothetical protein